MQYLFCVGNILLSSFSLLTLFILCICMRGGVLGDKVPLLVPR